MADADWLDRLSTGARAYALIALLALAAALPGVFRVPPLDRDESRYAQATAQMLETGDFIRIAVQNDPRHKKPVGIHWMQAASVSLFSQVEDRAIWAYRLPSVLGAVVAALATFWGGAILVGRRAAFLGATLFACSVLLGGEAMIAKTDAMLAGLTTLAMAALAQMYGRLGQETSLLRLRATAVVFWGAMGAAILVKGPVAPMVAGLCLLAIGFWDRSAAWMRALLWPPAILLGALIVLPWAIAIGVVTQGAFFAEAVGGDLGGKVVGGDEGHGGLPGYHAVLVWLLLFPASIALPAGIRLAWEAARSGHREPALGRVRFLVAWALPTWIAFELLPTKLAHYTLPVYPAVALLCGAGLLAAFERPWPWMRRLAGVLLVVIGGALVGASAYLTTLMPGDALADERRAIQTGMAGAALLLPAAIAFFVARRPVLAASAAAATALVFVFAVKQRILPEARDWLVSAEASNALVRAGLHPRLSPQEARLFSVGLREPSFVFLTRTDTQIDGYAAAAAEAQPAQSAIVDDSQRQPFEQALAARGLAFAPVGPPVVGFNYSNGDAVRLQPGRITVQGGETAPQSSP